jgi:hypothetical protein
VNTFDIPICSIGSLNYIFKKKVQALLISERTLNNATNESKCGLQEVTSPFSVFLESEEKPAPEA